MTKTKIDIQTDDGVADAYLFQPAGAGPWPPVLFYMDGLGIRDEMLAMAERVSSHGYVVLLPNLYYRSGALPRFDPKVVFAGGPERERLMALVRSLDNARVMRDTAVFLDTLAAQPAVLGQKFGCVGYCMSGAFALAAAGTFPDRIAAAASFHGARLATDAPDSPHLLAPQIRGSVYIGVAEIDQGHTPETTARLEAVLGGAGVAHTIDLYPRVAHGFAPRDLPPYDRDASERHWERLIALFEETLRPAS